MSSCNSSKRYEIVLGAALAVLVVAVLGSLLSAGFNMQVLV